MYPGLISEINYIVAYHVGTKRGVVFLGVQSFPVNILEERMSLDFLSPICT
jgi:hypothetical protein